MADLYAKLKQSIKDSDIFYIEPLSYIKLLNAHEYNEQCRPPKIMLFCDKASYATKHNKVNVKKEFGEYVQRPDLNLTGSPLKDSCQFDYIDESLDDSFDPKNAWTDEEESYRFIQLARAQLTFSQIAMMPEARKAPAFWAICGPNRENILLLSMELATEWNLRGIIKFNGLVEYETINLTDLCRKHSSYMPGQNGGQIETSIDSYFQLSSNRDCTITLQISRSISGPLTQPMLNDHEKKSKMILHQSICMENCDSVAEQFWRQIKILDVIKDTIVAYKETDNVNNLVYSVGALSELTAVKQKIYEKLTELTPIHCQTDDEDATNDVEAFVVKAGHRESVELTDQLWTVLKSCASYSILKDAFDYIFTCAAKVNVVNMPTNQNRLAQLIREVSEERIAIPHLNGSEPLELLIEIGLEKVTKDYEFIFTESKLCSSEDLKANKKGISHTISDGNQLNIRKSLKVQHLQNGTQKTSEMAGVQRKTLMHQVSDQNGDENTPELIGFQNSRFNLNRIEQDLARLGQIHLILEHLLVIRSNLNMENVYTTFLEDLRKPSIPFHLLKEMKTDDRKILVSNSKILSKIENELPHRQRIVMSSENRFKSIRNIFYYTVDPIFPPNVFTCIQTNDTKAKLYYAHQYLEIGSRLR